MADLKMPDVNEVFIAGRLTRDPELSYIASGQALCKFGVAVSRKFKSKSGEQKEDTAFINVTTWAKTAEYVGEHLHKGDPVLVHGRITQEEWEDKATGQKRNKTGVTADRVQSLSWPDGSKPAPKPQPRVIEEPIPEDEIPS